MKKKIRPLIIFGFLACLLVVPTAVFCQESAPSADALVKVLDLNKTLSKIDQIARSINPNQVPPSVMVQSMLQGTDWIDPGRAISLAVFLKPNISEIPDFSIIIPFREPNAQFQSSYNAVAGDDYYIVPLPPGKGGTVSGRMEKALVSALQKPPASTVSVEVAASQLLEKARPEIEKKLSELETSLSAEPEEEISPEQMRQMLDGLLDTGEQVEVFSMGFDLNDKEISFLSRIVALAGSELAGSLSAGPEKEDLLLAGYEPDHPIRFKSRPYDVSGLFDFLNEKFGDFYRQIGIDFKEMAGVAAQFSGEMAGGLSLTEKGFALEIISLLKADGDRPANYLENEYIPWVMDYGASLTAFLNSQAPGAEVDSLVEKMPESTIDGNTVYGLKFTIPTAQKGGAEDLEIPVRITLVENMLLTATDDSQIKTLLQKAGGLEKEAYAGPLMQMEMDLDEYLKTLARFAPAGALQEAGPIPSLGPLTYTMDISERTLESRYVLQVDDMRKMAAYLQSIAENSGGARQGGEAPPDPSGPAESPAAPSGENRGGADPKTGSASPPAAQETEKPDKGSPQYWIDRGQLYATYGNADEAIKHFQKAVELDPQNSKALFHLGVSYGDKGYFQKGIEALDKAIRLRPEDGDYYYARGWVYSLAGERGLARADMERAAALGNADAIAYMEKIQNR